MARYLLRRVGQALLVLWAAYTVSFMVLYLLPGDPVATMASGGLEQNPVSAAQLAALKKQYGLDKPAYAQYLDRIGAALHGNLGVSVQTGQPVSSTIAHALPQTLRLAGAALALGVVGGATLAVVATATRRQGLRHLLLSLPPLAVSLPTFWVGLMLVQLVSFRLRLLPAFGDGGVRTLVLPAVTLALPTGAAVAQVLAKSLGNATEDSYVMTARAKGVSRLGVHVRHALRNAVIPALTVAGVRAGEVLAGSVVIETVFSRNGIGRVTVTAVSYQDIPVVQGIVVLAAVVFVVVNLVVDLVYPLLDPRITSAAARRDAW